MGKGQLCLLFLVLFLILASLALMLTGIVTDYWYRVDASGSSNTTVKERFTYHFGMWRKCYTYSIPPEIPIDRRAGRCVYTYQDLFPRTMATFSASDERYLHLERSWIACLIAGAAIQVFAILTLICGLWPADCKSVKRSSLYLSASILCLFGAMCGITSGIIFIAMRDMDGTSRNFYPANTTHQYGWSFMLSWIGTGLCVIQGFFFLCLLKMDYNDINESGKYNTFM